MGEFWTVLGLGVATIGLLLAAAAAVLMTPRAKELLDSISGSPAVASSKNMAPPARESAPRGPVVAEHEDADLLIGRTLIVAQKNADDLERAAHARAREIVAEAEATANSVLQSAHDEASQILQKTSDEADAILGAAKQQATAWLTLLTTEADRMVLSAYGAFREAQRSVEQAVKSLPSELERRMADWAKGLPHGTQEATVPPSSGPTLVVDRHSTDAMRLYASADETPPTLGAHVTVTASSKNGHSSAF